MIVLYMIRRPMVVLLFLISLSCTEFFSAIKAVAFALSAKATQGRHHGSRAYHVNSPYRFGAYRTNLSITKSRQQLYSRLCVSKNNGLEWRKSRLIPSDDPYCEQKLTIHQHSRPSKSSLQASIQTNRRTAILQLFSISLISSYVSSSSYASEIDTSGQLFSPKNQMIKGGGSVAGRGIPLKAQNNRALRNTSLLKTSGLIQSVYETRFITYLTRFLLVYDPAARDWWLKNRVKSSSSNDNSSEDFSAGEEFAQFAESVEIGLADYFLGPYGSYASVAAAKAGLGAVAPAKSFNGDDDSASHGGFWSSIFNKDSGSGKQSKLKSKSSFSSSKGGKNVDAEQTTKQNRQGILNLFTLLSARYTSIEEKQQLAILFSLISKPELQPAQEIRGLLGEIDNGTIAEIQLEDVLSDDDDLSFKDNFHLSSRRGGGFASSDEPIIRIDPPAPLGDEYRPAKIHATMEPTSRILRIDVIDGGEGYTVAPDVIVKQSGVSCQCEAAAIIDRKGRVSEVVVLNPGLGYGGRPASRNTVLPTVQFRQRNSRHMKKSNSSPKVKSAKAVVELEYRVTEVKILDGGGGYSFDSPPDVTISLPVTDPDWFVAPKFRGRNFDEDENQYLTARVTKIKSGRSGAILDTATAAKEGIGQRVTRDMLRTVLRNPVALLPPSIRPELSQATNNGTAYYSIKSLPRPPSEDVLLPSNYRSIDPLFGGIGRAPVTKNALTLSADQYSRLALSGAICTVLVRTVLNPLELVKTKIQLGNDEEIIQYAMEKAKIKSKSSESKEQQGKGKPSLGTTQVIQSLVEVRGPLSLFQSADVTFLASIVFGLFGFGATELFRRSFSAVFFDETAAAANSPNEFVLLVAAGVATLLTCAAASPFELLRVRSMAQIENQGVKDIFKSVVEQNRQRRGIKTTSTSATSATTTSSIDRTVRVQIDDIKPFWSSFYPIVSRELPFAVTKFLVFDLVAGNIADFINSSNFMGSDTKIQVGVGTTGLLLSAFSGALAGIAGAFVSHPADLILTLTSASSREGGETKDWRDIVKELLSSDGGMLNLYAGFPARAVFFFLVIGAQFFLYDYVKTLLEVGTDDLTLVLDVFYAIRQGL